jgi:hypothetical protein
LRPFAEPTRLLPVAHCLAVRNRLKREPAAAVEVAAMQLQRQVELDELAGEVRVELTRRVVENGRRPFRTDPGAVEEHRLERGLGRDQPERPDRGVDDGPCHVVNLEREADAMCEAAKPKSVERAGIFV